jgi:hypothetical protein
MSGVVSSSHSRTFCRRDLIPFTLKVAIRIR